jgi:hypothetical protein
LVLTTGGEKHGWWLPPALTALLSIMSTTLPSIPIPTPTTVYSTLIVMLSIFAFPNQKASGLTVTLQSPRNLPPIFQEQIQKLFMENMAHHLILAHGFENTFTCPPEPSTKTLVDAVMEVLGHNRGMVPGGVEHACQDCAHVKQYVSDLTGKGAVLDAPAHSLADVDPEGPDVVRPLLFFFLICIDYAINVIALSSPWLAVACTGTCCSSGTC